MIAFCSQVSSCHERIDHFECSISLLLLSWNFCHSHSPLQKFATTIDSTFVSQRVPARIAEIAGTNISESTATSLLPAFDTETECKFIAKAQYLSPVTHASHGKSEQGDRLIPSTAPHGPQVSISVFLGTPTQRVR